jgi:cobyrinic acid a,c-diamide synthase
MSPLVGTPRIVVAGTASGVGKTTAAVGLMAALRARGLKLAPFKCGPDYLDPTYLVRAANAPSHNLDGWMMGQRAVARTFARGAGDADIAVIEGMMGLFDSATPTSETGSTAEIAKWLAAPVLLVLDASGIARTVAALGAGFASFDPELRLAGLICNRVGSRGHLNLLRQASPEVPVVGGLPSRADCAFPERHLGLFSAREQSIPSAWLETWGKLVSEWFDLDLVLQIARSAPPIEVADLAQEKAGPTRCRIGIAYDDAFHFYYEDNLRRLEALGAELVYFRPTDDRRLPEVDGLYLGGGYPEAAARELSSNRAMIEAIRDFAERGGPIYAECGGLMYLTQGIRTTEGAQFPMAGLFPGVAVMSDRLQALGYVEVETVGESLLGPPGLRFRGHQFRYSTLETPDDRGERVYRVVPRWGGERFAEGYRVYNVLASYIHAHWASNPRAAQGFVESCARWRRRHGTFTAT